MLHKGYAKVIAWLVQYSKSTPYYSRIFLSFSFSPTNLKQDFFFVNHGLQSSRDTEYISSTNQHVQPWLISLRTLTPPLPPPRLCPMPPPWRIMWEPFYPLSLRFQKSLKHRQQQKRCKSWNSRIAAVPKLWTHQQLQKDAKLRQKPKPRAKKTTPKRAIIAALTDDKLRKKR